MLTNHKGKRIEKNLQDYVVFDLETTGISCIYDEVVEISAIKVLGGKVKDEFSTLVNPQRTIPYAASRVNGITDEMVSDAPQFFEALKNFLDFAEEAVLVGHNIHTFDMKFIWRDAEKYFKAFPDNDYIDTLQMSKKCLPQLSHHKLTDLAEYYHISSAGAHRALNDCVMNQQVYEHLGKEVSNAGIQPEGTKVCPKCGCVMRKRNGKFGEFWGCTGFPECRFTQNI